MHHAVVRGDVKERRGNEGRRGRRRHRGLDRLAPIHRLSGGKYLTHRGNIHDVMDTTAVRKLRAFRSPSRPRCVENAGIVVGVDIGHGQITGPLHRVRPLCCRDRRVRFTYRHHRHIREVTGNLGKNCQPLIISHQELGL